MGLVTARITAKKTMICNQPLKVMTVPQKRSGRSSA